jgi:predicted ATPase
MQPRFLGVRTDGFPPSAAIGCLGATAPVPGRCIARPFRARRAPRKLRGKLWELRAAASLARLRRDQGRPAEARELLAPVYGWFTEGFDTPDLEEAKALLDELA